MAKDPLKEEMTDTIEKALRSLYGLTKDSRNVVRVDYRTLLVRVPLDYGTRDFQLQVKEMM